MVEPKSESLADIMAGEEARRLAETRAEVAAEDAAWKALSAEERAAIIAKREERLAIFDVEDGETVGDYEDEDEDADNDD